MKLKDLFCLVKNNRNGQTNMSLKKKKLKKLNISEAELFDYDLKFLLKK